MSELGSKLSNMLAALPVILMTTFANVIIATTMGIVTFMQLFWAYGWAKWSSSLVAVLIAIAVHVYIRLQPNIRRYIDRRSQ